MIEELELEQEENTEFELIELREEAITEEFKVVEEAFVIEEEMEFIAEL